MIPALFGCRGERLEKDEKAFFRDTDPAGFILFARNVSDPDGVRALVSDLKDSVGREHVAVLIDQEGGRVQRMAAPHWQAYPPIGVFGQAALDDPTLAASALRLNCRMIADDLRALGITVNCLPLLDLPVNGADNIIGDRALGAEPGLVSALGRIVVDAHLSTGVVPVIKHIPGHGRATADSHKALPVVTEGMEELAETDFAPFQALSDAPLAMTAHIRYDAIDDKSCATLSRVIIGRIIRMKMGFRGLLMSDDLSMQALDGTLADRARGAIDAGCDLALHCNGDMEEMQAIAGALGAATHHVQDSLLALLQEAAAAPQADRADLETRYSELMVRMKDQGYA